jgi:hypothetical protein
VKESKSAFRDLVALDRGLTTWRIQIADDKLLQVPGPEVLVHLVVSAQVGNIATKRVQSIFDGWVLVVCVYEDGHGASRQLWADWQGSGTYGEEDEK